jgi:hypothetical protein
MKRLETPNKGFRAEFAEIKKGNYEYYNDL